MTHSKDLLVTYLVSLGAGITRHGDRTLLDHLIGVHDLLMHWGNPSELCSIGLFHSIYGTSRYRHALLSRHERKQLQRLIGDEAESFVYSFSLVSARELPAIVSGSLDFAEPMDQEVIANLRSKDFIDGLCELHCANIVEQFQSTSAPAQDRRTIKALLDFFAVLDRVSSRGRADFLSVCMTAGNSQGCSHAEHRDHSLLC